MARPTKKGLDYIPLDVDFFDDDKLKFVSARFDEKGEIIAVKLLCKIYKTQGYFYQWGEDEALLFATGAGRNISPTLVNDVVQELVKRSFFDKRIFDRFKILTSKGIQERYQYICKGLKRPFEIDGRLDVRAMTQLKDAFSTSKEEFPPEETQQITEEMRQRKGKETKVKEMKGKSVENETWIDESCMAYSTDKRTLLEHCDSWILKAIPSGKFEEYTVNSLIRFMLKDFETQKNNHNGTNESKIGRVSKSDLADFIAGKDSGRSQ